MYIIVYNREHKFILFRGKWGFVKEDNLTGYHQNPISSCLKFKQASPNWTLCESSHPSVVWALMETHRSIYAELSTAGSLCCLNPSNSPALSRCSSLASSFGPHGPACLLLNHGPKGPSTCTFPRNVFTYFSGKKQNLYISVRLSSASFFYDFLELTCLQEKEILSVSTFVYLSHQFVQDLRVWQRSAAPHIRTLSHLLAETYHSKIDFVCC